jgi:hypothetical protein
VAGSNGGRKFDGQALLATVPGDAEATLSLAFTFAPRAQVQPYTPATLSLLGDKANPFLHRLAMEPLSTSFTTPTSTPSHNTSLLTSVDMAHYSFPSP